MSLTVEKLNDDTTFLFAFAPHFAPAKQSHRFPGAFTILVDPWLNGHSSILHPVFQISRHTTPPAIKSLADLEEEPDLIIISQDKPDHCHRQTLCQLPKDTHTRILATPAAANKIRAWKHFDPAIVHVMKPYVATKPADNLIRIEIPAYTSSSSSGEITVANLPTKMDVTKLHNAIGITYRPPGSLLTALGGEHIHLSDMMSPQTSPGLRKTRSAAMLAPTDAPTPLVTPPARTTSTSPPVHYPPNPTNSLPLTPPPDSPPKLQHTNTSRSLRQHTEKPISIIYTPHGVAPAVLKPYVKHHLGPSDALPLTALFHSVNVETNPWFMGGVVARGAPGGLPIAHELAAKHWISAHDEAKDNRGWATTWIKSRRYSIEDVKRELREAQGVEEGETEVHLLALGQMLRIHG